MVKLPRAPRVADLVQQEPDLRLLPTGTKLRRIYFLEGEHPAQWNSFRYYGPLEHSRFDHQEPPPSLGPRGVLYAAPQITTCLAEVFQQRRLINTRRRRPAVVSFALVRDVVLLDLTGLWPTRAGASMAISTGPRSASRAWSRAIYAAYPQADGLYYCSSMHANQPAVVLYERTLDILPTNPLLNVLLSDPRLFTPLRNAAFSLGYRLV